MRASGDTCATGSGRWRRRLWSAGSWAAAGLWAPPSTSRCPQRRCQPCSTTCPAGAVSPRSGSAALGHGRTAHAPTSGWWLCCARVSQLRGGGQGGRQACGLSEWAPFGHRSQPGPLGQSSLSSLFLPPVLGALPLSSTGVLARHHVGAGEATVNSPANSCCAEPGSPGTDGVTNTPAEQPPE